MKLEDLTIDQHVRGPSGAVYVVRDLRISSSPGFNKRPLTVKAILQTEDALTFNSWTGNSSDGTVEVDQQALEQFVVCAREEAAWKVTR